MSTEGGMEGHRVQATLTRRDTAHLYCLARSTGLEHEVIVRLALCRELRRWCRSRVAQSAINRMDEMLAWLETGGAGR